MQHSFVVIEPATPTLERFDVLFSDWSGWHCQQRFSDFSTARSQLPSLSADVLFCSVDQGFESIDWVLEWPQPPMIIAMARGREAALPSIERGLSGYLEKPFDPAKCEQLRRRLDQHFGRADSQSLLVRDGRDWVRISPSTVRYAYSADKQVWLVTDHGRYATDQP